MRISNATRRLNSGVPGHYDCGLVGIASNPNGTHYGLYLVYKGTAANFSTLVSENVLLIQLFSRGAMQLSVQVSPVDFFVTRYHNQNIRQKGRSSPQLTTSMRLGP